jgi:PadR family transcriptional regulator, regulatory protein PadR
MVYVPRMAQKGGSVQGTLDRLILRVLSRGEFHGWSVTEKLEQLSKNALRVEKGSLYPALDRMEDKGWLKSERRGTDKGQRAKYSSLTRAGKRQSRRRKNRGTG